MNENVFDSKYQIISELGAGGMSTVYRCFDLTLKRHVALKVLQPQNTLDKTALQRFQREGKAIASLSHSNIVAVLGFFVNADKQPYMVMEIAEGLSLANILKESGPLEYARTVRLGKQIANALAYVHSQKIIHRDLKPANIIVGPSDHVKLLDFGIAKILDEQSVKVTRTGESIGTPVYMSPEQSMGKVVDARTDQYSLGCVLFEMLTGRPPYEAENPVALSLLHAQEPIPQVSKSSKKRIPNKMETLVTKLLSKNPENRYYDMVEVREALDKFSADMSPATFAPKKNVVIVLAALSLAICGTFGIFSIVQNQPVATKVITKTKEQSTEDPLRERITRDDKAFAKFMREHPYITEWGREFKDSSVTDEGIKSMLACHNLEVMDFARCQNLTDKCAETIIKLPVKRIIFGDTNVGDDAVRILAHSPTINNLDLNDTKVTDASCKYFPTFRALRELSLSRTAVSDRGVESLGEFPRLEYLNLGDTSVKDLAHSLRAVNLKKLSLNTIRLRKIDFQRIAQLKKLEKLTLDNGVFDLNDILLLKSLPIKEISVHNVNISAAMMAKLKETWPGIEIDNKHSAIF